MRIPSEHSQNELPPSQRHLRPRTSGTLAPTLQFETMFSLLKRTLGLVICLGIVLVIGRPSLAEQILPGQQSTTVAPASNATAGDPLGRNTPSGTLYGFLQAAQSGNYS